jgi:hypothetical protein
MKSGTPVKDSKSRLTNNSNASFDRFVSGHDFSRADSAKKMNRVSQAAEKLVRVVGRGFIHGIKPIESVRASAPEACLFWISTKSGLSPQPV